MRRDQCVSMRQQALINLAQRSFLSVNAATVSASLCAQTCKHEVAMPPGMGEADEGMLSLTYDASRPPARTYAFELDPFQKAAVAAIEREESVRAPQTLACTFSLTHTLSLTDPHTHACTYARSRTHMHA
eukprot:2329065-Pleurochrysis_carterae.AAC.1